MFFSRTRPTVAKVAGMLRGETGGKAAAPAPRSGPRLNVLKAEAISAPLQLPVIRDIKDIPDGRYVSFEDLSIPAAFRESFAFKRTSEKSGNLLVAEEAVATHPQFEVQRRLVEQGIPGITIRKVSREIIKAVHAENQSVKSVEATETEVIARAIVDGGIERRASDIHIETKDSHARIYYRVFGERIEQPSIAKTTAVEVCNVLYGVHGDADSKGLDWDIKEVKDAVIAHVSPDGKDVQLRFSSGPRHPSGNFAAVMRLLVMDETTIRRVEDIGYTTAMVAAIEEMLAGGHGIVLLVGPTNSGKSSSMQAFIERIYEMRGRSIKVQTAEDPVEYVIPDAVQSSANNNRKGADFSSLVKGMLRQDPDVTMIGEIRDMDSAENVKNLVLTGRKVVTTMHVYEVLAAFARLREIGVPESVLFMKGFVSGVICQRLLPRLCPHCSKPITEAFEEGEIRQATYDRVMRVADLHVDNVRARGHGCKECNYLGIVGREIAAEMLVPDEKFLTYMAAGDLAAARNYWASHSTALNVDGMGVTMVAHAIQKMRAGLVSPKDIESIIGPIAVDVPMAASGRGVPLSAMEFPPSLAGPRSE